ncbi:MAG: TasA family protein [Candidatus Hadarchaeia archaeon]
MRKFTPIALSIALILVVAVVGGAGAMAQFTHRSSSNANFGDAGTIELSVDGDSDGSTLPWSFGDKIKPGDTIFTGFKTLKNEGDLDGVLTVTIKNLYSNEEDLTAAEIAAGDSAGVQLDPDGFSQESGYGELWDQITFSFVKDDGDGVLGWQDDTIGLYPDESGSYHIPVETPITLDSDFEVGEELGIGIKIHFIDDSNSSSGWILDGVSNNAAMSDTVEMDLDFDLVQQ